MADTTNVTMNLLMLLQRMAASNNNNENNNPVLNGMSNSLIMQFLTTIANPRPISNQANQLLNYQGSFIY